MRDKGIPILPYVYKYIMFKTCGLIIIIPTLTGELLGV